MKSKITFNERQTAFQAAIAFEIERHIVNFRQSVHQQPGNLPGPTTAEVVSSHSPWWPHSQTGGWSRRYYQLCILEGIKRTKTTPFSYFRLPAIFYER